MQKLKFTENPDDAGKILRKQLEGYFLEGESVCVKVHMGEAKNKYYLRPGMIKQIVGVLLEMGLKPFLFDSIVLYKGARDTVEKYLKTAEEHGFTEDTMGCPIVISDSGFEVESKNFNVFVCQELKGVDCLLDVSHVKGHPCYGFGGAIKNLGMGCVLPETKKDIHAGGLAETDEMLAEAAGAVLKQFRKSFFVNFIINISKGCDCMDDAGPIVAEDIGVLFGKDMVAIDQASVDLVYGKKPGIFDELHGKDPYLQIRYACDLGFGEAEYDIS